MRRRIALISAIAIFSAEVVYASDISVKMNGNDITVVATNDADSINAVRAMKKDGQASDKKDLVVLKNVTADDSGKVVFEFAMPDEKNGVPTDGEYTVTVKQQGKEAESIDFTYVSTANREEAVRALAESDDTASVVAVDSEYYDALNCVGLELDKFAELAGSQQSDALSVFDKSKADGDSLDVICEKFRTAVSISYINDGEAEYIGNINPVFDGEKYSNIESAGKTKWIEEYISDNAPYESTKDFDNAYAFANMLYNINNARFDVVGDMLGKYSEELGFEDDSAYKDYLDLSSSKRKKADEYITEELSDNPAKSVNDLTDVIDDAVDSLEDKKTTGGGGGGGGGGSSSKGSGTYVPSVTLPTETVQQEEEKKEFSDVSDNHWAKEAIDGLVSEGIVSGNGDGTFSPSRAVSREEFVKMLVMAYDLYDENAKCEFDDVADDAWYYSYVASAVKAGIVAGVDYNKFGSGNLITRQDMAVMSYRVMKKYGTLSSKRDYTGFGDEQGISDYALDSVKTLYGAEILNGDEYGMFNPQSSTTRAEAAAVIYKLIK